MTLDDAKAKGWMFKNHNECKDCGEAVEWWKTPSGNSACVNPMDRGSDQVVFHSTTCSERKS